MSIYDTKDDRPVITPYRQRKPKVAFDDEAMPYDASGAGPRGLPVLVDWDHFEDMLIEGKFQTKTEAVQYCRNVYTLVYDPDDEDTHWSEDSSWERIRRGLFPEARAALAALPHAYYPDRGPSKREFAEKLLAAGKCKNGHKIESEADLASTGCDRHGRQRLGCIHCRRERSRNTRANQSKEN